MNCILLSSTLATSCEELTHWKRLWCWKGLGAGEEGDDRGHGCMASLTQWTWVWVNSGSWWWSGRPGVLRFMGSQRVRHDWATELNWTESKKETKSQNFNLYLRQWWPKGYWFWIQAQGANTGFPVPTHGWQTCSQAMEDGGARTESSPVLWEEIKKLLLLVLLLLPS